MLPLSRRQFNASIAAGLAAPAILTSAVRGEKAPSAKINLGFIGVGTMGRGHLRSFLGYPEVRVVAVSDVVAERRDDAKKIVDTHYSKGKKADSKACLAFEDCRDLLKSKAGDDRGVELATGDGTHGGVLTTGQGGMGSA